MLTLLEKNSLNKLNMLRLFDESDETFFIDKIALKLGLDKRTIYSIIESIQDDIIKMDVSSHCNLVRKNNSFNLEKNSDFNLQLFVLFYLKQSLNFNFCNAIFNENFTTASHFSKANYVSLSTFKKKSDSLKLILNAFDLNLALNTSNFIIGEEKQIRHFYFYFFWTSYKTTEWPFKTIDFKEVKNYVYRHIKPSYNFSFSDIYKFILGLSISVIRIRQGHVITDDPLYTKIKNSNMPFDNFDLLLTPILKEFGIFDEEVLRIESDFLYFSISLLGIFPIQNYAELNLAHLEPTNNQISIDYTNFWITEFCSFFSITLLNSEYHYLQGNLLILFNKILYLRGPSANFDLLVSEKQLIENYPYYFENMSGFIQHLNTFNYFKKINQSDHHLIDFYVLIVWKILKKARPKLNITIQSSFSLLHMNILADNIIAVSPVPILINQNITLETALIVTDVYISDDFTFGADSFIWNTFPTKKQFDLLKIELLKKYKEQFPDIIN